MTKLTHYFYNKTDAKKYVIKRTTEIKNILLESIKNLNDGCKINFKSAFIISLDRKVKNGKNNET